MLIDSEKLREHIRNQSGGCDQNWDAMVLDLMVRDFCENEPEKEYAEVRHAHWIHLKYGSLKCSLCGNETIDRVLEHYCSYNPIFYDHYYCGKCGAIMDENPE